MKDDSAEVFYKERYGVDINAYGEIIRMSLESLYIKGVRLSNRQLYKKLAQCGIELRTGTLDRTRLTALIKKVRPEPPGLTHKGARMWYLTEPETFTDDDITFMANRFPLEMAQLYPSLWKGYMLSYARRHFPPYIECELLDRDECVFQQNCQRQESDGYAAGAV